jgi:hypothetical protein
MRIQKFSRCSRRIVRWNVVNEAFADRPDDSVPRLPGASSPISNAIDTSQITGTVLPQAVFHRQPEGLRHHGRR